MRAVNAKHGAGENQFGVNLGKLRGLAGTIKRDHELALTSPEPAWTEMCLFIPQDLLRRRREVPERALDVRRAVGGLCRLCERRQRFCSQRVDIALSHRALPYGLSPQSLVRVLLPRLQAGP